MKDDTAFDSMKAMAAGLHTLRCHASIYMHLSFSLDFAAGTSKGCLGVPLRCLKHDSKIPMGLNG